MTGLPREMYHQRDYTGKLTTEKLHLVLLLGVSGIYTIFGLLKPFGNEDIGKNQRGQIIGYVSI